MKHVAALPLLSRSLARSLSRSFFLINADTLKHKWNWGNGCVLNIDILYVGSAKGAFIQCDSPIQYQYQKQQQQQQRVS